MSKIVRSQTEIERVQNWAIGAMDSGNSKFPGMSYEEGILATLDWLFGMIDDAPDDE